MSCLTVFASESYANLHSVILPLLSLGVLPYDLSSSRVYPGTPGAGCNNTEAVMGLSFYTFHSLSAGFCGIKARCQDSGLVERLERLIKVSGA